MILHVDTNPVSWYWISLEKISATGIFPLKFNGRALVLYTNLILLFENTVKESILTVKFIASLLSYCTFSNNECHT
jgi:hypothetical protein